MNPAESGRAGATRRSSFVGCVPFARPWGKYVTAGSNGELPGAEPDVSGVSDFIASLRALKVHAGDPSYAVLSRRTGLATSTLADALSPRRRGLPPLRLVRSLVVACGGSPPALSRWDEAWWSVRARQMQAEDAGEKRVRTDSVSVASRVVSPSASRVVPRQLPAAAPGFIGRGDAYEALHSWDDAPVTVITGPAGVGKTTLAVYWAQRSVSLFPDGQLYIDLRGRAQDPALSATEALSLMLHSLGVPGEQIPLELPLQTMVYRTLLADRRLLLVLDNALDAAQIRPLLPPAGCRAIVTSRDALVGLIVREGARKISLDVLSAAEADSLLVAQLGADRLSTEPTKVAELVKLCGRLPLALRIAAANLASRPAQSLSGYVDELARGDRLAGLQVIDDPESAVLAAFDLSYSALDDESQRTFRLLGIAPGPEIGRPGTAVLLGRDQDDPVMELDRLVAAHLLYEPSPGRFRCHDLLALYALRRSEEEPLDTREAALHRLLSWYLLSVDRASLLATPTYPLNERSQTALEGQSADINDATAARSWLRAEEPTVLTAIAHSARLNFPAFSWHLLDGLRGHLFTQRRDVECLAAANAALTAAEDRADPLGMALAHSALAFAASLRGDSGTALTESTYAEARFEELGHSKGMARQLNNMADALMTRGNLDEALVRLTECLDHNPEHPLLGIALLNIGIIHRDLGQHQQSHDALCGHSSQLPCTTPLCAAPSMPPLRRCTPHGVDIPKPCARRNRGLRSPPPGRTTMFVWTHSCPDCACRVTSTMTPSDPTCYRRSTPCSMETSARPMTPAAESPWQTLCCA